LPDIYGVESWRFATQIVGIGQALALFVAFWLLRSRWPFSGAAFTMFGLLYFAGQFFLGFRRGDEALYLGPWRLPQAVDLILTLVAAVALMALWWQARGREGQPDLAEEATGDESLEPGHDDQADEQGEEGPEQIGEISQQDGALEVAREAVDSGNDAEATSSPDVVESQGSGESAEEIPRASE
jgi:hypothetical protein